MPFPFNIVLEVVVRAVRQERERKGMQIGKEEVKLFLFIDDMTLYIENSKECIKNLLELLNKFRKICCRI